MSIAEFPGAGATILPADEARAFTIHEIAKPRLAEIDDAIARNGANYNASTSAHMTGLVRDLRAIVDAPDRAVTPDDFTFSATARCRCGAGFCYPNAAKDSHGAWLCSAIFLGMAAAGSEHDAAKPFAFWEIKGEGQPSANGQTTRPDGKPPVALARCNECQVVGGHLVSCSREAEAPFRVVRAPHEQRVLDERRDLAEKLANLDAFRALPKFATLASVDQGLLVQQADYMRGYLNVLDNRIARFGEAA